MGKTKILENWTFTRSMPAPFDTEVLRRGKKDSTEESWIVNTFLDNFFKVVLPVLYRGLIS